MSIALKSSLLNHKVPFCLPTMTFPSYRDQRVSYTVIVKKPFYTLCTYMENTNIFMTASSRAFL